MNEPRKATLEVGDSPIKMIDVFTEKITGYDMKKIVKRCNKCGKKCFGIKGKINYKCEHGIKLTDENGKCFRILKKLPTIEKTYSGKRKLKKTDVSLYFNNISPSKRIKSKYCERCGILIGNGYYYTYTDTIIIPRKDSFALSLEVCYSCYDDKIIKHVKEAIPDIEDIVRFNVYL